MSEWVVSWGMLQVSVPHVGDAEYCVHLLPCHRARLLGRRNVGYLTLLILQQSEIWGMRSWYSLTSGHLITARKPHREVRNGVLEVHEPARRPGHWGSGLRTVSIQGWELQLNSLAKAAVVSGCRWVFYRRFRQQLCMQRPALCSPW